MTVPQTREIRLEDAGLMSPNVRRLCFRVAGAERFEFEPGQWVSLVLPVDGDRRIRAYSIASAPRGDATFELAVTRVTEGTSCNFLFEIEPGARLEFTGPFGTFLVREPVDRPIYFIATGTGVAPVRSMVLDLLDRRRTKVAVTLIFGVRTENDILYREEMEKLARKHANFQFVPALSRPPADWTGERGHVQAAGERLLKPWRNADIYVCGVKKMVDDVRSRLREWGYDRRQIHYERYD